MESSGGPCACALLLFRTRVRRAVREGRRPGSTGPRAARVAVSLPRPRADGGPGDPFSPPPRGDGTCRVSRSRLRPPPPAAHRGTRPRGSDAPAPEPPCRRDRLRGPPPSVTA